MTEPKPRRGHRLSEIDDVDLRFAARELAAARAALLVAHAIVERRERTEAIKTSIGRLALASRAIDQVVGRRCDS
jgi:predicted GNAT family N-acyltransferase